MLTYDHTISREVSLSRVLDEMVMDDTPIEVIVEFLRKHSNSIPDIYKESALVFAIYDVFANPVSSISREDKAFLYDNLKYLSSVDLFYAGVTAIISEKYKDITLFGSIDTGLINKVRKSMSTGDIITPTRGIFCGCSKDVEWIVNCNGVVELFNNANSDIRDIGSLVGCSYLFKSAMMYYNFMAMDSTTQLLLLSCMHKYINRGQTEVYVEIVFSLLKQLLYANQVEMFNWVLDVVNYGGWYVSTSLANHGFKFIPETIANEIRIKKSSFAEIVFSMNMLNTQFDTLNLFMTLYFGYANLFSQDGVSDLMEFFNLDFDWNKLQLFSTENK